MRIYYRITKIDTDGTGYRQKLYNVRPASACERCVAGIDVNAVFCFASTTVAYSHPASISACSRPRHCANAFVTARKEPVRSQDRNTSVQRHAPHSACCFWRDELQRRVGVGGGGVGGGGGDDGVAGVAAGATAAGAAGRPLRGVPRPAAQRGGGPRAQVRQAALRHGAGGGVPPPRTRRLRQGAADARQAQREPRGARARAPRRRARQRRGPRAAAQGQAHQGQRAGQRGPHGAAPRGAQLPVGRRRGGGALRALPGAAAGAPGRGRGPPQPQGLLGAARGGGGRPRRRRRRARPARPRAAPARPGRPARRRPALLRARHRRAALPGTTRRAGRVAGGGGRRQGARARRARTHLDGRKKAAKRCLRWAVEQFGSHQLLLGNAGVGKSATSVFRGTSLGSALKNVKLEMFLGRRRRLLASTST